MGVRVVTDSSSDLSPGVVDDLAIEVVPLTVRFGDEELVDRVELTPEAFWARLRTSDAVAQTAAPSPGDFEQAFAKVLAEGASAIVCVTLSSKVSATHQAASLAAAHFADRCPVVVVDSLSVSAGLGNLCLVAARRAAEGADASTVVREAEELRGTFGFYGAVETLEYLRRGGRIGTARALLGTALSIRPLLRFEQGTVEVAGKVRTRQRALAWVAERLAGDGGRDRRRRGRRRADGAGHGHPPRPGDGGRHLLQGEQAGDLNARGCTVASASGKQAAVALLGRLLSDAQ